MFPFRALQSCPRTMSLSTLTMISVYSPFSDVLIESQEFTNKRTTERNLHNILPRF